MKRLKETLNPDTSIPVHRIPPPSREVSRTYNLDSFKKSYAQAPRSSRWSNLTKSISHPGQSGLPLPHSGLPLPQSGLPLPAHNIRHNHPAKPFTRLSDSDDIDDEANNAETDELMRISKNAQMHYPTDAILARHQNNGKCHCDTCCKCPAVVNLRGSWTKLFNCLPIMNWRQFNLQSYISNLKKYNCSSVAASRFLNHHLSHLAD